MREKPWFGEGPVLPGHPPVGMLGSREASLCFHLTRDAFTGQGTIVDAGSFLGKSAYFFASGLAANRAYLPNTHKIHCFDNFLVNEEATIRFIREYLSRTLAVGASTRALFDRQVAAVSRMLVVHEGDFHKAVWPGEPIEILMVDIAKNEALGSRVAEIFFPNLMPGISLVIQQDYHHPWLPHIHVTMEYLAEYFELVAPRVDDSAVFLLRKAIPPTVLARAIRYDFTYQERLQLMDKAILRLAPEDRFYVKVARIVLQCGTADETLLRQELDGLETAFAKGDFGYSNNSYFEDVRNHIDELDGWRQARAGNYQGALDLAQSLLSHRVTGSVLILRGRALTGLGHYVEAEEALRAAMQNGRYPAHAYLELARALSHQHRFDEAEAELLEAMSDRQEMRSNARALLHLLGDILVARDDRAKAEAVLTRLLGQYPDDPEIRAARSRFLSQCGDVPQAGEVPQKAVGLGLQPERAAELRHPHQPHKAVPVPRAGNAAATPACAAPCSPLPWKTAFLPPAVTAVPSMLNFEEQQYLTWLAKEQYEGWGAIVELGCWLGASTVALAEGLRRGGSTAQIHSVDRFTWEPYMEAASHAGLQTGDDFLPLFLQEIGEYASSVRTHKMDLLSGRWDGGPIEILFVDSAKDWDTMNAVLRTFGPNLAPGRSRVVLQDLRYPWAHCLPLIVDSRPDLWKQVESSEDGDGATFILLKAIDGPGGMQEYSEDCFPAESAEHLFRSRMDRETAPNRARILKALYRKHLIEGTAVNVAAYREEVVSGGATPAEMAMIEDVEYILVPRGWKAYQAGDFEASRRFAERCLVIPGKRSVHAMTLLGFSLLRSGDREPAEACMNEVLSLSPGFPSAKLFRAELELTSGNPERAQREALEVLTSGLLDPTTTEWALNLLSQALIQGGNSIDPATSARLLSLLGGNSTFENLRARREFGLNT